MATPTIEIDEKVVQKAQSMQQIVADPKWKPLLDSLAHVNDQVLAQIRATPIEQREKIMELTIMWRHYENYLGTDSEHSFWCNRTKERVHAGGSSRKIARRKNRRLNTRWIWETVLKH